MEDEPSKQPIDFQEFEATDAMLGDGNLDEVSASDSDGELDMAIDDPFAIPEQPEEDAEPEEEGPGDDAVEGPKATEDDAVDGEEGADEIDWTRLGDGLNNGNFSTILPGSHRIKLLPENPKIKFGQMNDKYKCWFCHRPFKGPILMCPRAELRGKKLIPCFGIFHSWPCVLAFSNNDTIAIRQKEQRTILILKLAGGIVRPAPSILMTEAYGGKLTDEQYDLLLGNVNTRLVLPSEFSEYTFASQTPLLAYANEPEDDNELVNIARKQLDMLRDPQGFGSDTAVIPPDDALVPVQITSDTRSNTNVTRKSTRGGRGRGGRSKRGLPTTSLMSLMDSDNHVPDGNS